MASDGATASTYFLSYSRTDEQFALRFARDLQAQGVSVWVDQFDIRPSEHWDRAIERAVQRCGGLIVILSPRSVASDNVADEISFAIESGKKVLPILIERCTVPLRITRMHLIDATTDYDRALRQCVAEIVRTASGAAAPAAGEALPLFTPVALSSPEMVAAAERQLAAILGPIAALLVAKAAARAGSVPDLYRLLAETVPNEGDRARFLAASPANSGPAAAASAPERPAAASDTQAIPAGELDALGALLTTYLGPIAPLVVRREGRASQSLDELRQRLGALIPVERDRAAFFKRLDARAS